MGIGQKMIYLSQLYRYDLCGYILKLLPERFSPVFANGERNNKERERNETQEYETGGFFDSLRSDYNGKLRSNRRGL